MVGYSAYTGLPPGRPQTSTLATTANLTPAPDGRPPSARFGVIWRRHYAARPRSARVLAATVIHLMHPRRSSISKCVAGEDSTPERCGRSAGRRRRSFGRRHGGAVRLQNDDDIGQVDCGRLEPGGQLVLTLKQAERGATNSHGLGQWNLTFWLPAREVPTCGTGSATVGGLSRDRSSTVSGVDKAKNKAQDLGGKAKEAVGKVTGDKSTEHEGKGDQAKSNLKDAGEKVKDAFKK
jgi:uncharacterized protein YjbJ (UPF0337 family)